MGDAYYTHKLTVFIILYATFPGSEVRLTVDLVHSFMFVYGC